MFVFENLILTGHSKKGEKITKNGDLVTPTQRVFTHLDSFHQSRPLFILGGPLPPLEPLTGQLSASC